MSIDLRHGCGLAGLRALADHSVDHTISDPPFDARTHRAAVEVGDWHDGDRRIAGALPFDPLDDAQLDDVARELARVTRRWIVLFAAERQIEAWATALERHGARFVRLGLAVRKNPRPQQTGDRPAPAADQLVIAHAGSGPMRWNGGGRPARWDAREARWDTAGRRLHPCQKSVNLMTALVEDFTDRGELVLDPFAGVATTGLACARTGRRFLGWEIDADWHAEGLARLRDVREQLSLGLGA